MEKLGHESKARSVSQDASRAAVLYANYLTRFSKTGDINFDAPEFKSTAEVALNALTELKTNIQRGLQNRRNRSNPQFLPELLKLISTGQTLLSEEKTPYLETLIFLKRATLFVTYKSMPFWKAPVNRELPDFRFFSDPAYFPENFKRLVVKMAKTGAFFSVTHHDLSESNFVAQHHLPLFHLEFVSQPKFADGTLMSPAMYWIHDSSGHARARLSKDRMGQGPNRYDFELRGFVQDTEVLKKFEGFYKKLDLISDTSLKNEITQLLFIMTHENPIKDIYEIVPFLKRYPQLWDAYLRKGGNPNPPPRSIYGTSLPSSPATKWLFENYPVR